LPGWRRSARNNKRADKQPKPCGPRKPSVKPSVDDIDRKALDCLNERQRERALHDKALKSTVSAELVLGAMTALRSGLSWNKDKDNKIEDLWAAEESAMTSTQFKCCSFLDRLAILHDSSISTAFSSEYKRRITALLILHEHKQNHGSTSDTTTRQLQRLNKLSRKPSSDIRTISKCAHSWLRFVEAWGFGGLVLPGPGHQGA
jgi:hypothetical protein